MKTNTPPRAVLLSWLPIAFMISILIGFMYVAISQYARSAANEPQIYLAENLAADLFRNESPSAALSNQNIDIERSVEPFVVLYDSNGRAADGTGKLDGNLPSLPQGTYEEARAQGEVRLTWKPKNHTNIATVVRYYQSEKRAGFVLAGKNLREVTTQRNNLLLTSAVAWALALIGSLAITHFIQRRP